MSARQKRQTPLAGGASQVPSTDQSGPIVAASAEDAKALRTRGNAVRVQEARIIAALRVRPQTTDSFRAIGIFQISARIWGLRKQGWNIETKRVTVVDRDGYAHPRAALYSLVEEVPA